MYNRAKKKYADMVEQDQVGTKPFYRSKFWNADEREQAKTKKRRTWYATFDYETVLFVDSTPKGELAKRYRETLKEYGLKIRVVEKPGRPLKSMICRSDPFKEKSCGTDGCASCSAGEGRCKTRDAVYKISCNGCNESYIRETSRSIAERFNEHVR